MLLLGLRPKDCSYYNAGNLKIQRPRDCCSLVLVRISGQLGIVALGHNIASGSVTLITRRIRVPRNDFNTRKCSLICN